VHDLKAFWFLEKPVQPGVMRALLERAIQQSRLVAETERLSRQLSYQGVLGDMVGDSSPMKEVFSLIRQVAPTTASVLITGESGTGKELVARAIHRLSPRSGGPFVAVNCAALPESLVESYSAMKKDRLRAPRRAAWDVSNKPKTGLCCSMRSERCRSPRRPNCCA
jgi:DNA-binding NtrC family response regulator